MIGDEEGARRFCGERTDAAGLDKLDKLAALLREENAKQNLVSSASLDNVWLRHFADSLQLADHGLPHAGPLLDLGSGAGFPGLPLAIARPMSEVALIESRKRRVEWLGRCIEALELRNCRVLASRLESVDTVHAGAITARAFAPLGKLLRLSARFSTPATVWLLPKGRSAAQELAEQPMSVRQMFHVEQSATDAGGGILIGRGVPPTS